MQKAKTTKYDSTNLRVMLAIVLVCATAGIVLNWQLPGVSNYLRDRLMQARGTLAVPNDIVIVSIDDVSMAKLGRFPWSRALMARAIDTIAAAQPKAIALDVLFVDPTVPEEDNALAASIKRAGNVVLAAQLVDPPGIGEAPRWLRPLPNLSQAAAAIGHVNVNAETDGIARGFLTRLSDGAADVFFAMPLETVRVAEATPARAVTETSNSLLLGPRVIPLEFSNVTLSVAQLQGNAQTFRASRILIDYIGPSGSFHAQTYSFINVLEGRTPARQLMGKYVLVGSTAASMGDRLASPYVHYTDRQQNQHGAWMPGVEVLANALNTILQSRFYRDTPDWLAFILALIVAAITLFLLAASEGQHELVRQIFGLVGLAGAIVLAAYFSLAKLLIFPPLTPALISFACAGTLGLLMRSVSASSRLDASIAEIFKTGDVLVPIAPALAAAESIAQLAEASAAAIYTTGKAGRKQLIAAFGNPIFTAPVQIELGPQGAGQLLIQQSSGKTPSREALRICAAIAESACSLAEDQEAAKGGLLNWPRGLERKARALVNLNSRILERAQFLDLAMRSVEDGLIIAGADGFITFANPRAAEMLGTFERLLTGQNLFDRLTRATMDPHLLQDVMSKLLLDRAKVEREIAVTFARPRQYMLRMAAVTADDRSAGPVLGIVASLSDVTRQHQLQQTKNDVIALVSHEMRTPLTAIQGMSELLAAYEIEPERRREMNRVINDEVKRLTCMITEYLDLARLESGGTGVRRSLVKLDSLIERTLLLIEPLAGQRKIHLERNLDPGLPVLLADADLLSRAVGNLVSNAIKYSPPGTMVKIVTAFSDGNVSIHVSDQGYGIPPGDLDRIFEKFYRVPRIQDADVAGTGLGLAMVREIAELHGGRVTVSSVVNAGSTFTINLPRDED